ncbi:MAG TPA: hypothetical protein DD471_07560 [Planctomycetes bacterium]|jgi:hypothetical protein|nr:hypothetical protein [Planctomycetota bacterium]|tara:strand:- start:449 stop:970 length:522 start_codon:yes stop_codon:yes gene_type:complete
MARLIVTLTLLVTLIGCALSQASSAKGSADDDALSRTRKQVRMLDDIYKTTVVLITEKYVHDKDDFPAGSAAVALFQAVEKNGWHKVRLLDVAGEPIRRKNTAKDSFEKAGIAALKKGESYFEEVVSSDGQRQLRAMTAIPVVSKKCIMCHENYKDAKAGEAIGALSYTLTVE